MASHKLHIRPNGNRKSGFIEPDYPVEETIEDQLGLTDTGLDYIQKKLL